MRKLKILALTVLAGVSALIAAPQLAVFYVNNYVPGVHARLAQINLLDLNLTFYDVTVNKEYIKADIDKVKVYPNKDIYIYAINTNINYKQENVSEKKSNIKLFHSNYISIVKNDTSLVGTNLTLKSGIYNIESGKINYKNNIIDFKLLTIDNGRIHIDTASKQITKSFFNQKVKSIIAHGIEYYKNDMTAQSVFVDDMLAANDIAFNKENKLWTIKSVKINNKLISSNELIYSNIAFDLNKYTITSGGININYNNGEVEVSGKCSDWVNILFNDAGLSNDFSGGEFNFSFDIYKKTLHISQDCKLTCNNKNIKDVKSIFKYTAYRPNGETFIRESGPMSKEWVPLISIAENVYNNFIYLEDPSFKHHSGILNASLNVALSQNLEKGYIFRGGSTITQQLAKNIFLTREKNIERKAKELFLTIMLESCLSKEQILETYINVVEFGPSVYGINQAAKYHFNKFTSELTAEEGFYLASILPNPKDAKATPQSMLRAKSLMKRLVANGAIPENTLTDVDDIDLSGWEE